jgi:hypothetical protein
MLANAFLKGTFQARKPKVTSASSMLSDISKSSFAFWISETMASR